MDISTCLFIGGADQVINTTPTDHCITEVYSLKEMYGLKLWLVGVVSGCDTGWPDLIISME